MIRQIRILLAVGIFVLGLFQMLAFPKAANIQCVLIVWVTSFLVSVLSFHRKAFSATPISALQVNTFALSILVVPLVGTSFDGNPLIHNLRGPIFTFGYGALVVVVLSAVHFLYIRGALARKIRETVASKVLRTLGLFTPPSNSQLWMMGAVGCVALILMAFVFGRGKVDFEGFIPQLVRGFIPFSYAPFLIPVAHYFWPTRKPTHATWIAFGAYFIVITLLSMAMNARGTFAIPLTTMFLCVLLAMFMERLRINLFTFKVAGLAVFLFLIVMPSLMDLATAMRIARVQRDAVSTEALVGRSIELFFDKKRLRDYTKGYTAGYLRAGEWDERYLENEFLQRFSALKYIDNSIYYTKDFSDKDRRQLAEFIDKKVLALFPSPLLRLADIRFNKWSVLVMSTGDFVYYARTGFDYAGFRTGSFVGNGLAVYGLWFFVVFAVAAFFICLGFDCFALRERGGHSSEVTTVRIAPMILMFLFQIAFFFNSEAVPLYLSGFIRLLPQTVVIYLLLYWATYPIRLMTLAPYVKGVSLGKAESVSSRGQ